MSQHCGFETFRKIAAVQRNNVLKMSATTHIASAQRFDRPLALCSRCTEKVRFGICSKTITLNR
jgi:hypothetical protein